MGGLPLFYWRFMPTSELLLIAVALAMDAFAVSIATGVCLQQVSKRQTFRLAWHFGFFQGAMPILGWLMGLTVRDYIEAYDHWIAFILLGYLGYKMIREAFEQDDNACKTDPTKGMSLILLSVATSIDAFAVGLSLSILGISAWTPSLVIGIVAALFTAVGLHIGRIVACEECVAKYAEIIGGVVLIGIGVKILFDHGALG